MTVRPLRFVLPALLAGLLPLGVDAYPTDDGTRTGIRRLDWQRDIDRGKRKGKPTPAGAQWSAEGIQLRMTGPGRDFDLKADTPKDPTLQKGLEDALDRARFREYAVAVLDITDPAKPRYAAVNETRAQTPGSVAKVLVTAALLDQLAARFPEAADRERVLRSTMVVADDWSMPNSHEVPVVNGEQVAVRSVRRGDTFSLWEWMDHAISPSSNAAGTTVWREAILMKLLGEAYPPNARDGALYGRWSKADFTAAAFSAVDAPLTKAGIDPAGFKLRLFFTTGPSKYLSGESSRATPLALLQWMLRMEQGRMVDEFSSLELKRLMYLTRRRTRYVHSPALSSSAVFFKSGSLYQCRPEPGFVCRKYQGNKVNVLNGIIGVETPRAPAAEGQPAPRPHVYLVAVMSNELRRNASSDHAWLAGEIHKLVVGE